MKHYSQIFFVVIFVVLSLKRTKRKPIHRPPLSIFPCSALQPPSHRNINTIIEVVERCE